MFSEVLLVVESEACNLLFFFVQEVFEKVNKAYEFLCSRAKIMEGPNPHNIVLILKAQSILFSRFKDGDFILFVHRIWSIVLLMG